MTSLANHQSNETTKLLLVGNSGTGKSGALVSLIKAGYRVFICDFDNGLDIVKKIVTKEAPDKLANVFFKSFADERILSTTGLVVAKAGAFQEAMKAITAKWIEDDGTDMGNIRTWGPDTILVIDSLTHCCGAAFDMIKSLNGRLASGPNQSDWYDAQQEIENLLATLYNPKVRCNVIVNAHIDYIEDSLGMKKAHPMALGKALPPKIGTYFNTMLTTKTKGTGDNAARIIRTTPDGSLDVKYPMPPGGLPAELPIATGLASVFKALQQKLTESKAA
jgi:hypothetical protein